MAMHIGDIRHIEQRVMDGLVESQILELHVQGMQLTAQQAAGSEPALIQVQSHSGIELKVLDIVDGLWTLEVIKEADTS